MSATCNGCNNAIPAGSVVVKPGCGHSYDTNCIGNMFRNALAVNQRFSPCCNRPIELGLVREHLDDETVRRLENLWDTLRCSHPGCRTLLVLGKSFITTTRLFRCPRCNYGTCGKCGNQSGQNSCGTCSSQRQHGMRNGPHISTLE